MNFLGEGLIAAPDNNFNILVRIEQRRENDLLPVGLLLTIHLQDDVAGFQTGGVGGRPGANVTDAAFQSVGLAHLESHGESGCDQDDRKKEVKTDSHEEDEKTLPSRVVIERIGVVWIRFLILHPVNLYIAA